MRFVKVTFVPGGALSSKATPKVASPSQTNFTLILKNPNVPEDHSCQTRSSLWNLGRH